MKVLKLLIVLCGLYTNVLSQENGIFFRDFKNWAEVIEASKNESKPIFVDFYTTWCAPCKKMDKYVFSDSQVGSYFNNHFISIRIQMDSTKNDSDKIKKWYPELVDLTKRFLIDSYPSLVFISSKNEIINRYNGYQDIGNFLMLAKDAVNPSFRYVNHKDEYGKLIENYHRGIVNGESLVDALFSFHERAKGSANDNIVFFEGIDKVTDSLTSITMSYLRNQPLKMLLNKKALTIIGTLGLQSNDQLFKLFYPDLNKPDQIVGQKNFSRLVVDRAIRDEVFKMIPKRPKVSYKHLPNWDSLYNVIQAKYNTDFADRGIAAAKIAVLFQTHDFVKMPYYSEFIDGYIDLIEKHGLSSVLIYGLDLNWPGSQVTKGADLNNLMCVIIDGFLFENLVSQSSDRSQMVAGIKIYEKIMNWARLNNSTWIPNWCYDYGALVYKAGDARRAIDILEEGIKFAKENSKISVMESFIKENEVGIKKIQAGIPLWNNRN